MGFALRRLDPKSSAGIITPAGVFRLGLVLGRPLDDLSTTKYDTNPWALNKDELTRVFERLAVYRQDGDHRQAEIQPTPITLARVGVR